ncbi:MAG: ABC transporter ATP-binding protein, partial [Rhodoferax sp.]|nr:ABC transporter ATP-binding protein [Rhodoferax sp.]
DHTSELLKTAAGSVLRFKTDGALPPALAAQSRATGRIVQFPARNALEIEQYLSAVRQAGLHAEDVEIRKADLEDVFLAVMTKHRDVPAATPVLAATSSQAVKAVSP